VVPQGVMIGSIIIGGGANGETKKKNKKKTSGKSRSLPSEKEMRFGKRHS